MRIFTDFRGIPPESQFGAVALGNFDGVHRGHARVIDAARDVAHPWGAPLTVVTFEPHPRHLFRPDDLPFRLTPAPVKRRLMADLGVEVLVEIPFTSAFSRLTARDFVRQVLESGLQARAVIAGFDFVFGQGRAGSMDFLRSCLLPMGVIVREVAPAADAGGVWSSSRVRTCLEAGQMAEAAQILGRVWGIDGIVQPGAARGRTIGFPTANVPLADFQRPKRGVYAVRVDIDGGAQGVPGVANIGVRPTVDGATEMLEAHLFGWQGDLYGRRVHVAFADFIREERKFSGLEALKAQIADDATLAKRILGC
jgi:riboflavin kinase / FMN adenylyltransferase